VKTPAARYVLLALISTITVLLDQATKLQIMQSMRLHESIPVVPDFFSITYIRNPGAAFGILASSSNGFRLAFFGLTSVFALILLGTILYRLKPDDWGGQFSVAAVFGGAIGNLLDRVRFGEVVDFLDVYVGAYHWPAFNVADAAISVGVCFLAFHLAFDKPEPEPALQQNQSN
jgi:signal peptidase II